MDPRKFDGMIAKLSASLSRRNVVGGSVGAAVLAAVGLADETAGKKKKANEQDDVQAERGCLPTGKKCPRKPKNGKKLGCNRCCQQHSAPGSGGKVRCACRPNGMACGEKGAANCCSGNCVSGTCQPVNGPTPACGGEFETCCTTGEACDAGLVCNANDKCTTPVELCGQDGQTCCPPQDTCARELTCCGDTCVSLDTDSNCGECGRACPGDTVCNAGACQDQECLPVTELEGCIELADDGGLTLSTTCPDTYGAFAVSVPEGTTFSEIDSITTGFDFASGKCGAGSPRVCFRFTEESSCVCAQLPASSGCGTEGAEGSSGNLINNDAGGDWFVICDEPLGPVNTYDEALALYGELEIDYAFWVADTSGGQQTVTLDQCITAAGTNNRRR